jgi:transcriptional regulator with XRE-family HTH domain
MLIGQRLKEIREAKNLSQGDIEKRIGLLRCYMSRVENGHTAPTIEMLEKYARALEVPLYELFYEGEEPPKKPKLPSTEKAEPLWGTSGKEWSELRSFAKALGRTDDRHRRLLLAMAQRMTGRNRIKQPKTASACERGVSYETQSIVLFGACAGDNRFLRQLGSAGPQARQTAAAADRRRPPSDAGAQ